MNNALKFKEPVESKEELNARLKMMRKKGIAFSLCILVFILIFDIFPRSFQKRTFEYMLYDEKTNTVYVVDARTYNEWINRKGLQPEFITNNKTKFVNMTGDAPAKVRF